MANREHTRVIHIGDRVIGGGNPILIQSMTNTRTEDVEATVAQILRLEKAGCEIIRCTDLRGSPGNQGDQEADPYSACCRYSF